MAADVVAFQPNNGQALDNIPHMLRYWADQYESGQAVMPTAVVFVELLPDHSRPDFVILGEPISQITLLGLLQAAALRAGNNLEPKEE